MGFYYFLILLSVLLSAVAQVLLKKGSVLISDKSLSVYLNIYSISGYLLMFMITVFNYFIFRYLPMMAIVLFLPLVYVFIGLLSKIFFNENISGKKILASLLIGLGVITYYL